MRRWQEPGCILLVTDLVLIGAWGALLDEYESCSLAVRCSSCSVHEQTRELHDVTTAGRVSRHDGPDPAGQRRRRRRAVEGIESRGQRLGGHHRGVGLCRDGRRVYGDCVRLERRALESRRDTGFRCALRRLLQGRALLRRPDAGGDHRRRARVGPLLSTLEGNAGRLPEARVLLHRACHSSVHPESVERSDRHFCARLRSWGDLLKEPGRRTGGAYLVGSLVWGIGLSLGGTTGYAINPARDLGPRIAHALLPVAGKTSSDWNYASIPVLGPLVGGALAGVALRVLGVQ